MSRPSPEADHLPEPPPEQFSGRSSHCFGVPLCRVPLPELQGEEDPDRTPHEQSARKTGGLIAHCQAAVYLGTREYFYAGQGTGMQIEVLYSVKSIKVDGGSEAWL